MKKDYSIQMFTVDGEARNDLGKTLKKISDLGYKKVEFAGFYGHSAEEVKRFLDESGLSASSAHVPFQEIRDDFDKVVKFHKTIGNNVLITPMENLNSKDKIDSFIREVPIVQKKLQNEGFSLGYHNHLHEFHKNVDGSMIYDWIPNIENLFLEVDVGWVNAACWNSLEILDKYREKIRFIHLRDSVQYHGKVTGVPILDVYADCFNVGVGHPLSEGTVAIDESFKRAIKNNWQIVVECEAKVPDGITAAEKCMNYIKVLEKKWID
jgi:sugar phosphate isomerase/epimerase